MKRRYCAGCGRNFIRGHAVTLAKQDGSSRVTNVCRECKARAIVIVPELVAATIVHDDAKSKAETLRPFIAVLEGRARAVRVRVKQSIGILEGERDGAILETLEGVIHMLKEGRA